MAESFATEFTRPVSDNKPRDLLSQLYREIGISAVAAALDVLSAPQAASAEGADRRRVPPLLDNEDLAA